MDAERQTSSFSSSIRFINSTPKTDSDEICYLLELFSNLKNFVFLLTFVDQRIHGQRKSKATLTFEQGAPPMTMENNLFPSKSLNRSITS